MESIPESVSVTDPESSSGNVFVVEFQLTPGDIVTRISPRYFTRCCVCIGHVEMSVPSTMPFRSPAHLNSKFRVYYEHQTLSLPTLFVTDHLGEHYRLSPVIKDPADKFRDTPPFPSASASAEGIGPLSPILSQTMSTPSPGILQTPTPQQHNHTPQQHNHTHQHISPKRSECVEQTRCCGFF